LSKWWYSWSTNDTWSTSK